jgi:hypothetical protein
MIKLVRLVPLFSTCIEGNTMHKFVAMSLLGLCLIGCGGPADNPIDAKPPAAVDALRDLLTGLEKSGQPVGSGGMVISEHIEEIRKTDPAKADKLQPSADNLMGASSPAKFKSLAKEMLSNL